MEFNTFCSHNSNYYVLALQQALGNKIQQLTTNKINILMQFHIQISCWKTNLLTEGQSE